jgi:protein-disulfide isomerase
MHKHSREAAAWAVAASRVGKYDEVSNALFARQSEWSANGKVAEVASSVLSPEQAKKVRALAADPAIAAEIQREMQMGVAAGVNATPTLLISRKDKRYPVAGSLNYSLLRRLLDDLLKQ